MSAVRPPVRDVIVIGALGLLAVWLAAAGGSDPIPTASPAASGAAQAEASAARSLAAEAEGLWQRLRVAPEPLTPGRNPFAFAPVPRKREPARPSASVSPAASAVAGAPAARLPDLRLVGIAQEDAAGGAVRTAILSGGGQLFLARVGDEVASRFTVTAIGPDVVELHDALEDAPLRLALR